MSDLTNQEIATLKVLVRAKIKVMHRSPSLTGLAYKYEATLAKLEASKTTTR